MSKPKMVKVYVGCALASAPEDFKVFVSEVKKALVERNRGRIVVLEFLGLKRGTETDVYDTDIGNVRKCHFFVGFIDHASTGLGYELGVAIEKRRKLPFLILHHQQTMPNRLVAGAVKRHSNRGSLMGYSSVNQAVCLIEYHLRRNKFV